MVEAAVIIHGEKLDEALWVNFREHGMFSNLTLEKDCQVLFQEDIAEVKNGFGFFLEMFLNIESDNEAIVIKGKKQVEYLPMRVPIDVGILK